MNSYYGYLQFISRVNEGKTLLTIAGQNTMFS